MLKGVDRVQIAVADLNSAEKIATAVFGAEILRRDQVAPLGARRAILQAFPPGAQRQKRLGWLKQLIICARTLERRVS